MLSIDPLKLFLVAVVALALLGPDKLPAAARRVSSLLADLQKLRTSLHGHVQNTIDSLPLTDELNHARELLAQGKMLDARSLLERLASQESESRDDMQAEPATSENRENVNGVEQ
jgi:Sec-independent protein translocase protein TatA